MEVDESAKNGLLTFLRSHVVGTIGTIKTDNTPHAVSIYFYPDNDLHFYFITKDDTNKFTDLKGNKNVALVVTDPTLMQTVQVEGVGKQVNYPQEHADTIKNFTENLQKNGIDWMQTPFNHLTSGEYVVIEIVPTWIRWSDFKDWAHTNKFEQKFTTPALHSSQSPS